MQNEYFHKYLKVAPFALALWRAIEAQSLFDAFRSNSANSSSIFKRPLLDVGCGFGEFSGVFFDSQVEVGIDINIEDLLRAKKINKYKQLFIADARKMPFPANKFETVISISVLEHIVKPELAIKEIYRVLRPKGLFYFTVPTIELNASLFYPELLKMLRMQKLRTFYLNNYHKVFKHVSLFSPDKWYRITEKAGFKIIHKQGTFNKNTTKVFDLVLITALPSQISRWLFNSRWVWGLPIKQRVLDLLFNRLTKDKKLTNSNMLVVSQKV